MDDEPTDDELQESLDALSGTPGQDRLRTAGLMVVSLLPGGAQLVTFLGESIRTAHARRIEETIQIMAGELRRLSDRVDIHLRDETWAETFIDVVEESQRASERSRREAFAAILAHSLTPDRPSDQERLLFLDLVRRARTIHLQLIRLLLHPPPASGSSLLPLVTAALPDYPEDVIRLAWGDIGGWGLTNTSSLSGIMSRADLSGRLTGLGDRFAAFVTLSDDEA